MKKVRPTYRVAVCPGRPRPTPAALSLVVSVAALVMLAMVLTSCPYSLPSSPPPPTWPDPSDDGTVTTNLTLSDANSLIIKAPRAASCVEVGDTSGLPPGYILPPVEVDCALEDGETATISFVRVTRFESNHRIAYLDGDWAPIESTLSEQGFSISATVDHLSIWSVIEVTEPVQIEGTVTLDMGSAWFNAFPANATPEGTYLYVFLTTPDETDVDMEELVYSQYPLTWDGSTEVLTQEYLLQDVPPGPHVIAAFLDMDGTMLVDTDEPQGAYNDGELSDLSEDVDEIDIAIGEFAVIGDVTVDADLAAGIPDVVGKPVFVQLMREDPEDESLSEARYTLPATPYGVGSSAPWSYTVTSVPTSYVFVVAFADMDGDGNFDLDDGEPFGVSGEEFVVLTEDIRADIVIDTVNLGPEVTISAPTSGEVLEQFLFTVEGTASDPDEDPDAVVLVIARSDDVELGDPPELLGEPVIGPNDVPVALGSWEVEVDLEPFGNGDYYAYAEYTDPYGSMAYAIVPFRVASYDREGSAGDPIRVSVGSPHSGSVDTTYSYYVVDVDPGIYHLFSLVPDENNEPCVQLEAFDDAGFSNRIAGPDDDLFILPDVSSIYLRVSGQACTMGGSTYLISANVYHDPITISGTVTFAQAVRPGEHTLYLGLYREGYPNGAVWEESMVGEFDESTVIPFEFAGVDVGDYSVGAFVDDFDEDGEWNIYQEPYGQYPAQGGLERFLSNTVDVEVLVQYY